MGEEKRESILLAEIGKRAQYAAINAVAQPLGIIFPEDDIQIKNIKTQD
ncbi:MAG: hypothetical protein HZC11_00150 [Nitrospirae bacterium]|nr:hypothetical protein [Nitrospirota bacterium]